MSKSKAIRSMKTGGEKAYIDIDGIMFILPSSNGIFLCCWLDCQ
jgi:hypothetical protein